MAANLCCTVEQQGRSDSPELPNARIRSTAPANLHLFSNASGSPCSHFTSARTDDLLELQHIFEGARDHGSDHASPAQKPRARFSRTSMYSLHNLHKMTSMRSMIKRRFSKDLVRKNSSKVQDARTVAQGVDVGDQNTVVRQPRDLANGQLKVTKHDLRKDLLSDKGPEEGGYDSDAEVLDDVVKNVGKRAPSKRPSVHSIAWSASTSSKPTPRSSTKTRCAVKSDAKVQPYELRKSQAISFSARVSHIFSTPNLRADCSSERDHGFKRSQSTTSMGLPRVSPLSPLRLPSLASHNKDGRSWAEVLEESLRLPQPSTSPYSVGLRASETVLQIEQNLEASYCQDRTLESDTTSLSQTVKRDVPEEPRRDLELDVQQPVSLINNQPSEYLRSSAHENTQPAKETRDAQEAESINDNDGYDPRRSVHLHNMRISHHLRSGSLLSWDHFADSSELPSPSRSLHQRAISEQSRTLHVSRQLDRCERQSSSSGFTSTRVPSKWGRVIYQDRESPGDVASSTYSSRPHSPPDGFDESTVNLGRNLTGHDASKNSFIQLPEHRRSSSFPTDDEDTPRPLYRHGRVVMPDVPGPFEEHQSHTPETKLARKNSVADTKKSKFHEDFDPTPPHKKTTPTSSLLRFLKPKRLSMHSQSEGSLKSAPSIRTGDGVFDALSAPADRERRQSRSLMSLNTEHQALRCSKESDPVWDQALRAHQREKASLFLPENRERAVRASLFRARSGSVSPQLKSNGGGTHAEVGAKNTSRRPSKAMLNFDAANRSGPLTHQPSVTRRSAISGQDVGCPETELSNIFDRQGDGVEVVGAWGRYPSHTRVERSGSAGKSDRVESRDFALEAAIRFASGKATNEDEVEKLDPTERIPSLPLLPGQKKRKKKVGAGRMVKSNSTTFGRSILKNYSRVFKSQSAEFRRHGRNHRSSITAGGTLEFPELELLPEILPDRTPQEGNLGTGNGVTNQPSHWHANEVKGRARLQAEDSSSTLRPRRYSDVPDLSKRVFHDGAVDSEDTYDRARVWSAYYETCVPTMSRLNSEADLGLERPNAISQFSLESRPSSMRSRVIPASVMKHSRSASNVSGVSALSHKSMRPKFISFIDDTIVGERSIFSVRRSTMDLVLKFKEQETAEHERVLSFTRARSRRGKEDTMTL